MLVATIVLVAILTCLIFVLTIVAFSSLIKTEKIQIDLGNRDEEIKKDIEKEKRTSSKIANIVSSIIGGAVALSLLAASVVGFTYKLSGEQFTLNNHVNLVIASDSMDGFYNDSWKDELLSNFEEDALIKNQFKIGDILDFTLLDISEELIPGEVYAYKTNKGKTIVHRYLSTNEKGLIFRGDNAAGRDIYVNRNQVILHYTGHKVPNLGIFVLFSQSGFGLYSFISIVIVYVLGEVYSTKYDKIIKNRLKVISLIPKEIEENKSEELKEEKSIIDSDKKVVPEGKKLIQFKTRNGTIVSFYGKDKKANK